MGVGLPRFGYIGLNRVGWGGVELACLGLGWSRLGPTVCAWVGLVWIGLDGAGLA